MQGRARGKFGAAMRLVRAALVAAVPVQRLEDVALPAAALLVAQLRAAHLAAAAAGRHRAAASAPTVSALGGAAGRPRTQICLKEARAWPDWGSN